MQGPIEVLWRTDKKMLSLTLRCSDAGRIKKIVLSSAACCWGVCPSGTEPALLQVSEGKGEVCLAGRGFREHVRTTRWPLKARGLAALRDQEWRSGAGAGEVPGLWVTRPWKKAGLCCGRCSLPSVSLGLSVLICRKDSWDFLLFQRAKERKKENIMFAG